MNNRRYVNNYFANRETLSTIRSNGLMCNYMDPNCNFIKLNVLCRQSVYIIIYFKVLEQNIDFYF